MHARAHLAPPLARSKGAIMAAVDRPGPRLSSAGQGAQMGSAAARWRGWRVSQTQTRSAPARGRDGPAGRSPSEYLGLGSVLIPVTKVVLLYWIFEHHRSIKFLYIIHASKEDLESGHEGPDRVSSSYFVKIPRILNKSTRTPISSLSLR
jgi:hypothetical protein